MINLLLLLSNTDEPNPWFILSLFVGASLFVGTLLLCMEVIPKWIENRHKCPHDWETITEYTSEKEVTVENDNRDYDEGKSYHTKTTTTYTPHIVLMKCKRCGEILKKEIG